MNNFYHLILGEMNRMRKYHIMAASMVTALLWIGILHFTNVEDLTTLFPIILFVDATTMSMLMIGVTMFFEKQEGVMKSLFVSPINKYEYILSKTFANISSNLITLFLMYLYAILVKEIHVNIIGITGAVLLIAVLHSLIGFLLTYYAKDFTNMLIGMMKYILVLALPVLLVQLDIIKSDIVSKILYFVPTRASMILLEANAKGHLETWEIVLSLGYMVLGAIILFFVVSKEFDKFAVKESGV